MIFALIAAAGINADIDVNLPVTCNYISQDLHGNPLPTTIVRWRAMKDGVQWKSKKGPPWIGSSFNCADFGITKTAYDGADYFLFDTDRGTMPMCMPNKPCPCEILVYHVGFSTKNACP